MKIARISSCTYTPGALEYFSFIRGGIGADHHQNPYFHQFHDGAVMAIWHAYDFDECSNDGVLLYSISRDRGMTWSDPQVYIADYPGGIVHSQMLRLRSGRDTLMVACQTQMDELTIDPSRRIATKMSDYFSSRTRVFVRRSSDGGRWFDHGQELPHATISGDRALPGVGFYGSNDDLVQLDDGRIIAAFIFLDPQRVSIDKHGAVQHFTGVCMLSDDDGRSWRRGGEIVSQTPRGVMEPQIVEVAPRRLLCLFRTTAGWLYQTLSEDGGETWSDSRQSALPSPEAMARMIKLRSGNLLLVWNNVSSTSQAPRHPLVAAVSRDGGKSWDEPRVIARESGTNHLSNHGLIQLDDGRILLGISRYHDIRPMNSDFDLAIFDERWLENDWRKQS